MNRLLATLPHSSLLQVRSTNSCVITDIRTPRKLRFFRKLIILQRMKPYWDSLPSQTVYTQLDWTFFWWLRVFRKDDLQRLPIILTPSTSKTGAASLFKKAFPTSKGTILSSEHWIWCVISLPWSLLYLVSYYFSLLVTVWPDLRIPMTMHLRTAPHLCMLPPRQGTQHLRPLGYHYGSLGAPDPHLLWEGHHWYLCTGCFCFLGGLPLR